MKRSARLRSFFLALLTLTLTASLPAQSALPGPANRIASGADMHPTTRLIGNLPRWIPLATDAGPVPPETPLHITLMLSRTAERETAFTQLLVDQQNPSSPMYHQWLTPTQIGEQFGPSMDDIAAITTWLTEQRLSVASIAPSRVFMDVTGTTGTVATALGTTFHHFLLDGTPRLSATSEPSIPVALASVVIGFDGLTELPLRPFSSVKVADPQASTNRARPRGSNSANTVHYVYPGDFAKIYDVPTLSGGIYPGSGVRVAIIGRSQVASSDITLLEGIAGLPLNTPNVIIPPGSSNPGFNTTTGDQDESTLDVGRVLTTSPGAQADLIIAASTLTGGGITAGMQYNVQTLIDPVMTISYGLCESMAGATNVSFYDALFKQGAAEGISTFVSSGDSAAAGCSTAGATPRGTEVLGINYLCASSYVTCVGGTELNDTAAPSNYWSATNSSTFTSALGYIPEAAWNEPTYQKTTGGVTSTAYQISGTGGGSSVFIPKPTWQAGTGVPGDGVRDTPDISFTSAGHDPYFACLAYKGTAYDCSTGGGTLFYGTSAAAPDMASVAAILVQRTGKAQGNLNPLLYALAASTPAAFHDATPASSGVAGCAVTTASACNNSTPGSSALTGGLTGYALQVGYDEATGLGSLDVTNFINAASGITLLPSTTTLTAQPMTIAVGRSVVFTATVNARGTAAVSGTVQFYSNGSLLGSPAAIANGSVSTSATTFTSAGTYAITATYSGNTAYAPSTSTAFNFVVTALPSTTTTLTASPTTIVAGKTATLTANVAITSTTAPTGTVQFFSNGSALGAPVAVASGAASLTSNFIASGTYAITASYVGDTANSPSTSAALSFVVTAATPIGLTLSASPTTLTLTAGATTSNTSAISVLTTGSYFGSVVLTCAVSYSGGTATYPPTCSFAPTALIFTGGLTGSSVLTVATTLPHTSAGPAQAARNKAPATPVAGMGLAAILLLLLPSRRRRRISLLAMLLGAGLAATAGCGSGIVALVTTATPAGTSSGSYTVTVTATPGAGAAVTALLKLTVQ